MITLNSNEYFSGLVNFILFMRLYALNKSKKEKTIVDVFATETLEYGDQKAFPFAEMPKVEDYSLTSSLLSDKPIKYSEEFIGDPIKKKIALSYIRPYLQMAMMDANGMSIFVGHILGLMETTKEDYLYNEIMKDLISWTPTNAAKTGKKLNQSINLYNETGAASASEIMARRQLNQENIEIAWQKTFDDFSIYSDAFLDVDNATDGTNFKSGLNLDDLIFIGNAKYLNEQVVSLMATLLKSDVIDKNFRKPYLLKVPQITFDDNNASNIVGFVAHKHWYQWFYHFNFMGSFFDVDTVRTKNVLHFWYSKGRLKGLPASKLTANYVDFPTT